MWIGWFSVHSLKKWLVVFFLIGKDKESNTIHNVRTVYVDVDLFLVLEVVLQEEPFHSCFFSLQVSRTNGEVAIIPIFAAAANTSLGLWTHHAGLCQPCPFQHNCAHFRWLLSASPRRFVCTNSPEQKPPPLPDRVRKSNAFSKVKNQSVMPQIRAKT